MLFPPRPQVLLIQRCFRGFLGRERARLRRRERNASLREQYFARAAVEIQRHWRGYVVRQRVLDFNQRKQFITGVLRANKKVRAEAQTELDKLATHMAMETERQEQDLLVGTLSRCVEAPVVVITPSHICSPLQPPFCLYDKSLLTHLALPSPRITPPRRTHRMHYMLSTRHREGPLQSPMLGSIGLESMPSISGRPVEDVVRDTARARRQGAAGELPPVTVTGSFKTKASLNRTGNPKDSPLFRQTIRSSEAYGEYQRLEYIEHRAKHRAINTMHKRDFVVNTSEKIAEAVVTRFPPLNASLPYRDPVNYVLKGTRTRDTGKDVGPLFKSQIKTQGQFDDSIVA